MLSFKVTFSLFVDFFSGVKHLTSENKICNLRWDGNKNSTYLKRAAMRMEIQMYVDVFLKGVK